jgi:two-component system, NtrC family, response regulator AtoC
MQDLSWNSNISESKNIPETVILGLTAAMQGVVNRVRKVGPTEIPVLIRGESGTGKEVIARLLHQYSRVRNGPFVKLNCAAIPNTLLESELFGYERGAFTGAHGTKPGRVEAANGGTLLLDEIGDMDPSLQSKLLHLLQDGSYCRIGGREDRYAQVRVICATNVDLEAAMDSQSFRRDLFYRIGVVTISLPPLRERKADIPLLANYFLKNLSERFGKEIKPLSDNMFTLMSEYDWPGNIRELQNWVARYIILGLEDVLLQELERRTNSTAKIEDPPVQESAAHSDQDDDHDLKRSSRKAAQERERELIQRTLEANQWNRRKTAQQLHISYRALLYKMQDAGVLSNRAKKH